MYYLHTTNCGLCNISYVHPIDHQSIHVGNDFCKKIRKYKKNTRKTYILHTNTEYPWKMEHRNSIASLLLKSMQN